MHVSFGIIVVLVLYLPWDSMVAKCVSQVFQCCSCASCARPLSAHGLWNCQAHFMKIRQPRVLTSSISKLREIITFMERLV